MPGADAGDEVVLLGAQGEDGIRVEERVETGGPVYEVTTLPRAGPARRFHGEAPGPRAHQARCSEHAPPARRSRFDPHR